MEQTVGNHSKTILGHLNVQKDRDYCRICTREVKCQYTLGLQTFLGCKQVAATSSRVSTNLKRIRVGRYGWICLQQNISYFIAHGIATRSIVSVQICISTGLKGQRAYLRFSSILHNNRKKDKSGGDDHNLDNVQIGQLSRYTTKFWNSS